MDEATHINQRFPWWGYALFALMFGGLASFSFSEGRLAFASFFVLFGVLQIVAIVINHFNPPQETMENQS
jgi:hypothetical protein